MTVLKHADLWRAIDALAEKNGMSPSALARKAGLDATTFNKSKRIGPDGRKRWPSTESLSNILAATKTSFNDFVGLVTKNPSVSQIPVVALQRATNDNLFDEAGAPTGAGWTSLAFPAFASDAVFAVTISGKTFEPFFRAGDTVIADPAASPKKGDRVVLKPASGAPLFAELVKDSGKKVDVIGLNGKGAKSYSRADLAVFAKIVMVKT